VQDYTALEGTLEGELCSF